MEEIFNDYLGFLRFGKEVILNILKKSDIKLSKIEESILEKKSEKDGEYFRLKDERKKLKEIMNPYIELYKKLKDAEESSEESGEEELNKAKEIIKNLMEMNDLDKAKILKEIKLREEFQGKSGAEVVRNFLEYQNKELRSSKLKLSDRAALLLKEEAQLRHELEEAVQESESAVILEKLFNKGKEIEEISEKILICEDRIKEVVEDLESEWKFQIYGTISKEELRNRI